MQTHGLRVVTSSTIRNANILRIQAISSNEYVYNSRTWYSYALYGCEHWIMKYQIIIRNIIVNQIYVKRILFRI